jgi:hypothetical protein
MMFSQSGGIFKPWIITAFIDALFDPLPQILHGKRIKAVIMHGYDGTTYSAVA